MNEALHISDVTFKFSNVLWVTNQHRQRVSMNPSDIPTEMPFYNIKTFTERKLPIIADMKVVVGTQFFV